MKHLLKTTLQQMIYTLNKWRYPIPKVFDRLTTSVLLAQNPKLSMIRYGDGELGMILSEYSIGFQSYDAKLAQRLYNILASPKDPDILVCIPDLFNSTSALKEQPRTYWDRWIISKRTSLHRILLADSYGDSLVSRLYLPWVDTSRETEIIDNLKQTWKHKVVTIVEGTKTRWGVGNDLLSETKSVRRILCPAENAFLCYDAILSACKNYINRTDIFIISLGPTATVLAYDLAKLGARALDLGHLDLQYDYLRNQANSRTGITGKYDNESNETDVEECRDKDYLNSIVERIEDETHNSETCRK